MSEKDKNPIAAKVASLATGKEAMSSAPSINKIPTIVKIVPSSKRVDTKSVENTEQERQNFVSAAKSLEPLLDKITGIISAAGVKAVEISAESMIDDEKIVARLSENMEISEASREAIKTAGSRIIARRVTNDESLDYAILAAALGEIGIGYTLVVKELLSLKKLYGQNKQQEQQTI